MDRGGGTEPWQERGTALAQILFDSGAGVTTRLARWAPAGLQLTELSGGEVIRVHVKAPDLAVSPACLHALSLRIFSPPV